MVRHNGQEIALAPGEMTLFDTSLPYDAWREAGRTRVLILEFPQDLPALPRTAVEKLAGARLGSRAGTGALLWTFATRAARDLDRYRPTEAVRVSTTLLDLVGGLLTHELQAGQRLGRSRRELTDPMSDDRPIHAIAARWGFPTASHFTRVFRSAYGLSPQEYREQAKPARLMG
jgi:AraC-like DNA-binding protein